jgi:hypothetical protein
MIGLMLNVKQCCLPVLPYSVQTACARPTTGYLLWYVGSILWQCSDFHDCRGRVNHFTHTPAQVYKLLN